MAETGTMFSANDRCDDTYLSHTEMGTQITNAGQDLSPERRFQNYDLAQQTADGFTVIEDDAYNEENFESDEEEKTFQDKAELTMVVD